MVNKTFTFPDGGNLYAEYSGSKNNTVVFTADENKGDDRELTLTFRTALNSVQVQRRVIQEGGPYTFELSAITSSNANLGVQLGWQYSNGTSVAQPFNLNGEEYNATLTNYWTNDTTEHTYNVVAQRGVGKNYVFCTNIYNNANYITSATVESDLPAVNIAYCFNNCRNLTSVEGGHLNVTNMYSTFYYCHNLTSLDALANWNVAKVTNMYQMFYNCCNAQTHCSNSWTGASANCVDMFRYCNSLDDIQIHWNITCAANMFANRNTSLNVYASTNTNAYNAIYRAMGNSTTNSSWNVTLYELNE